MSRFSLTLLSIFALSLAACDRSAPDEAQESGASPAAIGEFDRMMAGELMPAINVTDLDGHELNLGALQGEPLLVNLWATWCAPCVKEMPLLDELAADYDGRVRVVTVSQDMGSEEKVAEFFAQNDFAYLESWRDPNAELGFALGDVMLPTTVLYDASGQEIWRVQGDLDWSGEEARAAIDEALDNG